jgi:predicted AAA+ superfamily ATPase
MNSGPVIFDEVQYASDLVPYIKARIDDRRQVHGHYRLTASQDLPLTEQVPGTLAGRAAVLRLVPMSSREEFERSLDPLPWEPQNRGSTVGRIAPRDFWKSLLRGGYPELVAEPKRDLSLWHWSYLRTYLERDVRSLRQIGDLLWFQGFLRVLAARTGQLLNLTEVARDLGVAVNTAKGWLSVLEATYRAIVLRPYHANVGKRLAKAPKIYFTDTGTICYLARLKDPEHAAAGPLGGAILEIALLSEIVKAFVNRGEDPQIYFWRTSTGAEVELVVETGDDLIPIEVKLSATPDPAMANGILAFQEDLGEKAAAGIVVHPGGVRLPLAPRIVTLAFEAF